MKTTQSFQGSRCIILGLTILLACCVAGLTGCIREKGSEFSQKRNTTERTETSYTAETAKKSGSTESADQKALDADIEIRDRVVCMMTGDSWSIPVYNEENASGRPVDRSALNWKSSNKEIASVDPEGTVHALSKGYAIISCRDSGGEETIFVNVFDCLGGGSWWDMDMLVGPDQVRNYRNYAQGAWEYGDYSTYVAWHGCALCCTATIIRAWFPEEDWTPQKVLSRLEQEASKEDFEKNYAKSIRKQMPLSLKGISRVLEVKDIPHTYVTRFDKETVAEELADCLRQGQPVIYEAGRGGYHMLMLLGILTDGRVLVSDSVGEMRVRITTLDNVADQMFSCKEDPQKSYFAGRKTAGGYILCGKAAQ